MQIVRKNFLKILKDGGISMRAIYNFCKAQIKAKKLNRKPVL